MSGSISVREHILWQPETQPQEPTDTLVLTAPSGRFVDIRILKSATQNPPDFGIKSRQPTRRTTYSNVNQNPSPTNSTSAPLSPASLDWAFAGTSTSQTLSNNPAINNGGSYRFTRWFHAIDSRHADTTNVSDEGSMYPSPSSPHDKTLEVGAMVNPDTGSVTGYEELWSDLEIQRVGGGGLRCLVLRFGAEKGGAVGVGGWIVRLGGFVQGVLRVGGEFGCERWDFVGGEWGRRYKVGELELPCKLVAMEGERVKREGEVRCGEALWEIVEEVEWEDSEQ